MINYRKLAKNCEICITKPCQIGCPLDNDIPSFIEEIKNKNYQKSFEILSNTSVLIPICSRICPHLKQCEGSCLKGVTYAKVEIGLLESMIGDMMLKNNWQIKYPQKTKYKVAVIGSGPSGLTCASFLRRNGINVTIYEKYNYLGGLLSHGIPSFRLPKQIVKKTIDLVISNKIKVKYNQELEKNIFLEDLKKQYDAIYLAIGANISNKINIPGENIPGVYGGNELLEHNLNIDYKNKEVVVLGGGNVAMDVSRTIKRAQAKRVTIIYRRSEKEMPADKKEINDAKNDGIEFIYLTNITEIKGTNKVDGVEVVRTKLDELGNPETIEGSNYFIPCDYVIEALGSHIDPLVDNINLAKNPQGKILIDAKGQTSDEKIFAGGDVAGTKSTVAWASRAGRNAAYSIIKYLETIHTK